MMAVGLDSSILGGYSHIEALELELERNEKLYSITCEQEASRRLRVDLLLLHDENADLQAQLLEKEERVDLLEEDLEGQNAALEQLNVAMNNLQVELRTRLEDIERLRIECNALQRQQQHSAKILEEKLALSYELSTIKPEFEHLKAQKAQYAGVLSEKLALQREMQALQVQLEDEKRAVQQAKSQDNGPSAREAELQSELDKVNADLATERTTRKQLERESKKVDGDSAAHTAALESRLEAFREKLKGAKELIKSTKAELEESRKANERLLQEKNRLVPAVRGKRSFSHMDADATIGTPDGFPPKKLNRTSALLGERSEFPITPFLNPTAKLNIETPVEEQQEEEQAEEEAEAEAPPVEVKAKKTTTKAPKAAPKPRVRQPKATKAAAQKKTVQLDDVAEEDEDAEAVAAQPAPIVTEVQEEAPAKAAIPKKKRRVLGAGSGKTLFDDDDMGTGKIDSRGGLDDFKFAMPKRIQLNVKGATAFGVKGKATAMSGFGAAFSPLKKDRKQTSR